MRFKLVLLLRVTNVLFPGPGIPFFFPAPQTILSTLQMLDVQTPSVTLHTSYEGHEHFFSLCDLNYLSSAMVIAYTVTPS